MLKLKKENLILGFSEKNNGQMAVQSSKISNLNNRIRFLRKAYPQINNIAATIQTHSNRVKNIKTSVSRKIYINYDGLITDKRGIWLTLSFADCFPVYFYNSQTKAIGIAHCGWRGSLNTLLPKCLNLLKPIKHLKIWTGPGIQKCHFEIKEDIIKKFKKFPDCIINKNSKFYVDIPKIIKARLTAYGVKKHQIFTNDQCTYCEKNMYFSFRRDRPKKVQSMVGYIGLI